MVTFGEAIKLGFKNAFKFGGTSTRAEFWWFALFAYILNVAVNLIDAMFGIDMVLGGFGDVLGGPISLALQFVLFFPQLSLLIRRFRDTKVSPYWLITGLIPLAGLTTWVINHSDMFNDFLLAANGTVSQSDAIVEKWLNDPSVTDAFAQFGLILLLLVAFGIFQLVVELLPSKNPKQPVVATIDY